MEKIKRLEFIADPRAGFETHDIIREGRSATIDPLKLSAVLKEIQEKVNEIIDRLNGLTP